MHNVKVAIFCLVYVYFTFQPMHHGYNSKMNIELQTALWNIVLLITTTHHATLIPYLATITISTGEAWGGLSLSLPKRGVSVWHTVSFKLIKK